MPRVPNPTQPGVGSSSALVRLDPVRTYINSARRTDCWPESVTEASGLQPGSASLTFPGAYYGGQPAKVGDFVEIKIGSRVIFRGHISDPEESQTVSAESVAFTAQDVRARLNDTFCERDYNLLNPRRDGYLETLYVRDILRDMLRQFNRFTSGGDGKAQPHPKTISVRTSRLPNTFPGEVLVKGMPIGQAIEQLVSKVEGVYGVRIEYVGSSNVLSFFPFPATGRTDEWAHVVRGTDITSGPRNQPHGTANVLPTRAVGYSHVRNQITVVGAPKVTETLLTIREGSTDGRAWNTNIEAAVIAQPGLADPGTDDEPNADYIPEAVHVGRRYSIPTVILSQYSTGSAVEATTRIKFLSRLVQPNPVSGMATEMTPFLVYKFSGDTNYTLLLGDEFTIENDRYVVLKEMLVNDAGEVPDEVYLEIAGQGVQGRRYTTSVQGSASSNVVRHVQMERPDFQWEIISSGLKLSASGGQLAAIGSSISTTSETVIDDDSATASQRRAGIRMRTWAENTVKEWSEPTRTYSYVCPRGDTSYKIGARVKENGTDTQAVIVSITHNIGASENPTRTTTVHAEG